LPPPGSYKLDHIQRVPQALVLEATLFPRPLSHYTKGAVTLLGFFYSYCADPDGCPLAWDAFEKVREEILVRPQLYGHARLVFMSLDPKHDTPDVLSGFARRYEANAQIVPWHFLTTYSYLFLESASSAKESPSAAPSIRANRQSASRIWRSGPSELRPPRTRA
jgi:protein SCO1/2